MKFYLGCKKTVLFYARMHCYILVWLGFLEIVPEEQRTVGSVMLQFI